MGQGSQIIHRIRKEKMGDTAIYVSKITHRTRLISLDEYEFVGIFNGEATGKIISEDIEETLKGND